MIRKRARLSRRRAFIYGTAALVAGIFLVLAIRAATAPASFEAETGSLAAGAKSVLSSTASGGSAVKFGATIFNSHGCIPATAAPSNADPGSVVIADNFETGDFSKWSNAFVGGDATATVGTSLFNSGHCAASVHVSSKLLSEANLNKTLAPVAKDVWASGWFDMTREGANPANNVPTMRFFNGTTRLLDVSRQNGSGVLFVRWPSGSTISWNDTGKTLALRKGYNIKIHFVAAGSKSQVQVWLDGVKVFDRSNINLGTNAAISNFMVGADHDTQDGDFTADDILLKVVN